MASDHKQLQEIMRHLQATVYTPGPYYKQPVACTKRKLRVLTGGSIVGRRVVYQGHICILKAGSVSHFILLECLAVHNRDFDCPHTGDGIKNEGISPKPFVQHILAVVPVRKGPWELHIFIPNSISLPDVVSLH